MKFSYKILIGKIVVAVVLVALVVFGLPFLPANVLTVLSPQLIALMGAAVGAAIADVHGFLKMKAESPEE